MNDTSTKASIAQITFGWADAEYHLPKCAGCNRRATDGQTILTARSDWMTTKHGQRHRETRTYCGEECFTAAFPTGEYNAMLDEAKLRHGRTLAAMARESEALRQKEVRDAAERLRLLNERAIGRMLAGDTFCPHCNGGGYRFIADTAERCYCYGTVRAATG